MVLNHTHYLNIELVTSFHKSSGDIFTFVGKLEKDFIKKRINSIKFRLV
tara:strand:- start:1848 stop:1994 length:147 start_codon:yes stop_codon:yes gene_type:complete